MTPRSGTRARGGPLPCGGEPALTSATGALSRDEVRARVMDLAGRIADHVSAGARVAVMGGNTAPTLLAQLATTLSGAALVPLSVHLTPVEIRELATRVDLTLVLVGPEHLSTVTAAVDGLPIDVIELAAADRERTEGSRELDGRVSPPVLFTSGTTGRPAAVALPPALFPAGATVDDYVAWARRHRFAAYESHIVAGPLYHAGPVQASHLLAAGVHVVLPERFEPLDFLALIEEHHVQTSLMVPTHFVRLLAAFDNRDGPVGDVSSIRLVLQTGSGCPIEVKRRMIDWWGPVFLESYGGTESGGLATIGSDEWLAHPGSVGRVTPAYEVVVVGPTGERLPAGVEGRLYFRDRSGRGIRYEGDDAKTAAAHLEPGVFTLGEIGFVDEDGYLFITDRASDMVLSGGVNLYPAEAERVLSDHPMIDDVAVIGVPHAEMGEQLRAVVVLAGQPAPTPAEVIAFCRARLAHPKCPRSVVFVDSLDRTPMGKLDKRALAVRHGATP